MTRRLEFHQIWDFAGSLNMHDFFKELNYKERMNYYCEQDVKKVENSYAIIILIVHCPSQSHYGIKKTPISTHQRYVEPHSRICDRIATAKLTVS